MACERSSTSVLAFFLFLIVRLPFSSIFFFFNDTATTEIYTLSLHDALPISDTLYRGSNWVSANTWTFTDAGNLNYRLKIVSVYKTEKDQTRRDSTETTISCNTFL